MAATARTARAAAARDLRDTVTAGTLEVDRAPVTNKRYAVFVAATGHRPPLFWPRGECPLALLDHPVTGVDFFDALAFALWADGSLPTEEQWLAAAGLQEPAAYVWGDFFDSKRCNTAKSGIKGTTPAGAYAEGTAPSGCVDLCGNVWEMTCTAFPGDSDSILVKGGSWADLPAHARLDTQFRTRVNKGSGTVGFRLVYGVPGLLPHFADRELVDQCIAYRHGDAPHFDADGDKGEFDAIVESLRQTAGPHLAKLEAEARASLVGSETGAPAPAAPHLPGRLRDALREIGRASLWRRIMPVLRVFAQPGRGRSTADRFRAAWAEAHRPRRGAPLKQALTAAAVALFPDRGRTLRARLRAAGSQLFHPGGPRTRMGRAWRVLNGRTVPGRERVKIRPQTVAVRGRAPAAVPSGPRAKHPRRIFILLCVFAGTVLGLLGTMMRGRDEGRERAPLEARVVAAPAPAPPPASTAEPAPTAQAPAAPALPSTTRELSAEDVQVVMRRLVGGRPQERDEAERFLIWHCAETTASIRAALETKIEPPLRAALEYVAAAIEEEKSPRAGAPTVVSSPPQRGLVLVTDSLEAAEEIAMVRRTGKAARLEVTVVFIGAGEPARIAKTYATALGDVRLYVDTDGGFARKHKPERFPAVVGLGDDGRAVSIVYGRVRRSLLADLAGKLVR